MSVDRPHWLTVAEAGRALRTRSLSAQDLVADTLDWIEESDSVTHAWVTVAREAALAAADRADRDFAAGVDRGPFQGIGFGVKDLVAVAGMPMGAGSDIARDFVPREDATVVNQMLRAGAVCLGKTVTHEFAFGSTTPPSRNPWDGRSVPGGSSGGSAAAVAAGQTAAAIGTDCCCSLRNPAALTGICSIRPTYGRVSATGVVPASLGLDTVGPLCRTIEDVALMLGVMSSFDPSDPRSSRAPILDFAQSLSDLGTGLSGLRIGVPDSYFFEHLEADVERAVNDAIETLRKMGATLHPVQLPHAQYATPAFFVQVVAEQGALQHDHIRERPEQFGEDVRRSAELGNLILAKDYIRAQQMRSLIVQDWGHAFEGVDLIVTPATGATAKEPTDHPVFIDVEYPDGFVEDVVFAYGRFLIPVSMAGLPGLAVPCGISGERLPIGLQIVAPAFDEVTALRAGAALERELDLLTARPPAITALAESTRT